MGKKAHPYQHPPALTIGIGLWTSGCAEAQRRRMGFGHGLVSLRIFRFKTLIVFEEINPNPA